MDLHSNSHISLDFDPWLPENVNGDKAKFQQILSSMMELALLMNDRGEISLKVNLEAMFAQEHQYLLSFKINFKPTSPHSKVIISHLLFKTAEIGRTELK